MKHRLLLCLGPLFGLIASCSSPAPKKPPLPSVTVIQPKISDVPIYLEYPGHIEAYKTVNLQAQVSGDLTGMYFEEGQEVKKGQLLFTIDDRPYQAALAKAEAALRGSIAALKYSKETVSRYTDLAKEKFVSQLNYDEYVTNSLEHDASMQANLAELDTARINLSYCTLSAPMDSVAGKKEIDIGNFISVGEQTPLIVLNQIDPVFAAFYVPDVDLPIIQTMQLKSGPLSTEIYLNGEKSESFKGTLTLIDNLVDQATGSIFMKATIPNSEKDLWPGEFVDVRIILSTQKNAILLPSQAIQLGQKGYFTFVINKENKAELRLVEIGQRYDEYISIVSGIEPEDTVVLNGQLNLTSGDQVLILSEEKEKKVQATPKAVSSFNLKKGLESIRTKQGRSS